MRTDNTPGESDVALDLLFNSLASSYRRRLLALVRDGNSESMARDELVTALAAWDNEKTTDQVTDEEYDQSLRTLHHVHFPKLNSAGLLDDDTDEATVTLTDHPAFQDPGLQQILDDDSTELQSRDVLFEALANTRRQTILDILSHQYQSIHMQTLARELIAKEQDISERNVPEEAVEECLISLYHSQLPMLRDAGLIEYDADEQTVAYEGHPDLRVPWMHSQLGPNFRVSLTAGPPDAKVGNIEGRENVVSYGQSLVEEADEELFMMFTTTGLLEAGCFTRLKQAVERDVDIYIGTQDPTVREFVQENAPSVTLWEPDTNWLDLPVEEDSVGRLVFADREAVLIGTLGEETDEGIHEEEAIVGEGADNTLVVLMRQMLRTRLDQFAEKGEEIESELQF